MLIHDGCRPGLLSLLTLRSLATSRLHRIQAHRELKMQQEKDSVKNEATPTFKPDITGYASLVHFIEECLPAHVQDHHQHHNDRLKVDSSAEHPILASNMAQTFDTGLRWSELNELRAVKMVAGIHAQNRRRDLLLPASLLQSWYQAMCEPRIEVPDTDLTAMVPPSELVDDVDVLIAWKKEMRAMREEAVKAAKMQARAVARSHKIEMPQVKAEDFDGLSYLPVSKFAKVMGHVRRVQAENRVLLGGSPLLQALKSDVTSGRITRLLAFDVEAYEHDQRMLLELGAAIYTLPTSEGSTPTLEVYHFIMEEHAKRKNGHFCECNRDNYSFGASQHWPLTRVLNWLHRQMLQDGTALLGHNLPADLKYLNEARMQAKTGKATGGFAQFSSKAWLASRPAHDTQAIFREVHLRPHDEKLEKLLTYYGIPAKYLHNAGNDAYYTMVIALRMADMPFVEPINNACAVDSTTPLKKRKSQA